MKTVIGLLERISKISTKEALLMVIPVAVVSVALWAYPWGRVIVAVVIVGSGLVLLALLWLVVRLKGNAWHDHS